MSPIVPANIAIPTNLAPPAAPQPGGGQDASVSFKDLLVESISQVNDMQVDADRAVEQLMTGGDADMAEVLTAVQKADISFKLMMQLRNKVVEAYQEINQIRV